MQQNNRSDPDLLIRLDERMRSMQSQLAHLLVTMAAMPTVSLARYR